MYCRTRTGRELLVGRSLRTQQPVVDVAEGERVEDGLGEVEVAPSGDHDPLGGGVERAHTCEEIDGALAIARVVRHHERDGATVLLVALEVIQGARRLVLGLDAVIGRVALAELGSEDL
jgi:hypothetical protein